MGLIYGRNTVTEAIISGKTINKIYIQKSSKELYDIIHLAKKNKIVIVEADKQKLDKMIEYKNSQGIVASITDFEYSTIDEILESVENLEKEKKSSIVLILDKIEDPHNLGAIIRTAECMGVSGIIIQKRNACQITDTVEKVAVGATQYVKVARVTNITESIKYLQENGFWIYGLDMNGESKLYDTKFEGKIGIVVGNEGNGISRLVKENCDFMLNIPMYGKINSLNASVSVAMCLYEVRKNLDK